MTRAAARRAPFRLRRFERRILLAMLVVAVGPLVGALVLGRQALREAYEVGINDRVGGQLDQGLALYRRHFVQLRASAERTADAIAAQVAAAGDAAPDRLAALLAAYPEVRAITLEGDGGGRVERAPSDPPADERLIDLERPTERGLVRVTLGAPSALFDEYQRAGELRDVYARLARDRAYVSATYLFVFSAFLGTIILAVLVAGVVLTRRVTRRVGLLAEATARVGSGDLGVSLPVDEDDEVAELTRAFNRMVRDLARSRDRIDYLQRVSAWQEFARRLAHEIKNPLTPIQLAMQEVHRSYDGADVAHARKLEDARIIVEEEIATLRRLVGEFSAFARLPEARLEPADLADVVREQGRALRSIPDEEASDGDGDGDGGGPEVAVTVTLPDAPVPVDVDPMLLRRALDNLVRNAVQAIRGARRGGRVEVAVLRDEREGAGVVEVRDDGPGVPPALVQRLFDPYVTTRVDGTGLGLAIVKKVVLEHGGSIDHRARPGGGAIFRVSLPLRARRGPR